MRDTIATRMFITSFWPEGDVHLERAELGIAPPGHRTNLRRRNKARNLVETGDVMEFDTYAAGCATYRELDGMRTRIEFVPID